MCSNFLTHPHANLDAYVNARKWHSLNITSVGCKRCQVGDRAACFRAHHAEAARHRGQEYVDAADADRQCHLLPQPI